MKLPSNKKTGWLEFKCWMALHRLRLRLHPCEVASALEKAVAYLELAGVEGNVAEFGSCMTARTARVLHHALRGTGRQLHLFDSFRGLPRPASDTDKSSPMVKAGKWREGLHDGMSPEWLGKVCPGAVIHAGWFDETVQALPTELTFAMVHVDCNLYSSTMQALSPLLARGQLSRGAVILFDDWHTNQASNGFGERAAWGALVGEYGIECELDGSYGVTGKRVIIQSYEMEDQGGA